MKNKPSLYYYNGLTPDQKHYEESKEFIGYLALLLPLDRISDTVSRSIGVPLYFPKNNRKPDDKTINDYNGKCFTKTTLEDYINKFSYRPEDILSSVKERLKEFEENKCEKEYPNFHLALKIMIVLLEGRIDSQKSKTKNTMSKNTVTLDKAINLVVESYGSNPFTIENLYKRLSSKFEAGEIGLIGYVTTDNKLPVDYTTFKRQVVKLMNVNLNYKVSYGPVFRSYQLKAVSTDTQTGKANPSVTKNNNVKDLFYRAVASFDPKKDDAVLSNAMYKTQELKKKNEAIVARFNVYVKNNALNHFKNAAYLNTVSVKQLQSAFKKEGWTCADINNALRAKTTPTLEVNHVSKNLYKLKYL